MSDARNSASAIVSSAANGLEEKWRARVAELLGGSGVESLGYVGPEGIAIHPLYNRPRRRPASIPGRGATDWRVLARVDHPDPRVAGELAAVDLAQGADGLHLVFAGALGSYGFGLPGTDRQTLATLFDKLPCENGLEIEIDLPPEARDVPAQLATLVRDRHVDPSAFAVTFGFDPLGTMAARGAAVLDWQALAPTAALLARDCMSHGFHGRFFVADGRAIHAAGGSPVQELAFVLSAALAYLRALEGTGGALEAARKTISFRLAADADFMFGIAKVRALRRLWGCVEDACGLTPAPIRVHAETAWRMMSARDPWTNILRTAIAAAAAGLGGADAITVLPFTQAIGLPDAFARRLARNTQIVLLEEAHLAKVADPAFGAGSFETLTEDLCIKAWALLQDDERDGGLYEALRTGRLQAGVSAIAEKRVRDIALRKIQLTGINEFPDIHEGKVDVLEKMPPAPQANAADSEFAPLLGRRDTEPYERLRDRADAFAAHFGESPKIFLANFGPVSAFGARAIFAKNLFEAGGIEALGNDGFKTVREAAEAFARSGSSIACICSSDRLYGESGADLARALAAIGARHIYLAGQPGEYEETLRAAGVNDFVHLGCDIPQILEGALTSAEGENAK